MRACALRSLSMLAATVLLSVSQLSPATAASVNVSQNSFDFGNVPLGTTGIVEITANATPDPGFRFGSWLFGGAPFSQSIVGSSCGSDPTCVLHLSFSPTATGDFSQAVMLGIVEFPPPPGPPLFEPSLAFVTLSGTGVAAPGGTLSAPSATPLPATLPLFATGLGALGLLGWRRKRKTHASVLGAA